MRELTIVVLLFILPQELLAESTGADLLNSCGGDSLQCQNKAKTIEKTISPGLISDICKSKHANVELTCDTIVGRALELKAELPVDYLKKECFGSAPKKRLICDKIHGKCNSYPKSTSCSKIIPKQANLNSAAVQELLHECEITENACQTTAQLEAKNIKQEEILELCKKDEPGGEVACRHIIRESLKISRDMLSVSKWKDLCENNSDRFCKEVVDACAPPDPAGSDVFCDELEKTIEDLDPVRKRELMLSIVVMCSLVLAFAINGILCVLYIGRKKFFKSYYLKKQLKREAEIEKLIAVKRIADRKRELVAQKEARAVLEHLVDLEEERLAKLERVQRSTRKQPSENKGDVASPPASRHKSDVLQAK